MEMQTALPAENAVGNAAEPYMRLVGNEELDAMAVKPEPTPQLTNLAAHMQTLWEAAKYAKNFVEKEMLMDYRQRQGIYEPEKMAEINEQGGSEIYIMLTSIKCAALEAWIKDVMIPADDKNWLAESTPVPDLPPDKLQELQQTIFAQAQQAMMAGVTQEEIMARKWLRRRWSQRSSSLLMKQLSAWNLRWKTRFRKEVLILLWVKSFQTW